MRTAHWKAHLLPLLLLLLHSVSVCLAAICSFDEYMSKAGSSNVTTAAHQPKGQRWEPIRIVASIKNFKDASKFCLTDAKTIRPSGLKDTLGCKDIFDKLSPIEQRKLMGILQRAIALHTDRLLVQRAVGPLMIPDFSNVEGCKYFNVPKGHHTNGVANADMVLYVGVIRFLGVGPTESLGLTCAKSAGGRPIAGALVFGSVNIEISRHTVRLAAHQIAHALGFSYNEMKSRNMIVDKNMRGKSFPAGVVKSDKTKEMTQAHYGCFLAGGMELEDGENNNMQLSHWERRNAKDELMATPVSHFPTAFIGFYTNITLAVFEDLGFYKANFKMAEHMEYGYNAGCLFLNVPCMVLGVTKWSNMFCDTPLIGKEKRHCTTDRLGLGFCALKEDYSSPLSKHFQYFLSSKKGGSEFSLTDYCPVVEQEKLFGCTDPAAPGTAPGSLFGKNSMCLDGNALKVNSNTGAVSVDAVCAAISCEGGSVKVKYLGDAKNKWYDCPEGQSLTPSSTSDSFRDGKINCPKYKEVCTVAPDGSSLVPGATRHSNSITLVYDSSSMPFGLIPSVAFLVFSFAGYMIA